MMGTYRLGDPDFDAIREAFYDRCRYHFGGPTSIVPPIVQDDLAAERARFYDMVRRHLADLPLTPTVKRKGKTKPAQAPSPGRDGQRYEKVRVSLVQDKARNDATDVLTWLSYKHKLNSEIVPPITDQKRDAAFQDGRQRIDTANKLQALFQVAQLTPLRSPDPSEIGGGGFGPKFIGEAKLRAMLTVQDLRTDIPESCMVLLEQILLENRLERATSSRDEKRIYQQVRMAIDFAFWSFERTRPGIDPYDKASTELCRRWPQAFEWITGRRLQTVTVAMRRDSPNQAGAAKQKSA
jgi:hypothetical protein